MSFITIDAHDTKGRRVEVLVDASSPPAFGETFKDEGKTYVRVPSVPQKPRVKQYRFIGHSLPNKKHALAQGRTLAKNYDDKGRPAFDSRREVQEYMAKFNDNPVEGHQLEWDPDGGIGDEDD